MSFKNPVIPMILSVFFSIPAHAADAHVHGEARLSVAVDGHVLTLLLDSPADNLAGFEHAPRNAKERSALKHMEETLKQASKLFLPTPAAHCKPQTVKLESDLLEHAPEHAHTREQHDHGDAHADVEAEYRFQCASPEHLHNLEVTLFQHFPGVEKLAVEVAAPNGQKAAQLTRGQRRLNW
jgi:hypothetical protein